MKLKENGEAAPVRVPLPMTVAPFRIWIVSPEAAAPPPVLFAVPEKLIVWPKTLVVGAFTRVRVPAGVTRVSSPSSLGVKANRRARSKDGDARRLDERRRVWDRMLNTFFHVM